MKSIRIQVGHPFIRMLQIHTSIWVIRSTCARTVSVLGSPQEWLKKNRQLVCFSSWFAWQLEKKQFSRRNESRSKKVAAMLRTEYEPTTRIRSSSSWQVVLSSETSRSGPSHWQTLIYHATPTFQWKPTSNRRRRLFPRGVFPPRSTWIFCKSSWTSASKPVAWNLGASRMGLFAEQLISRESWD